jgi:hypothetical protein
MRFTLRELFESITLISVGFGFFALALFSESWPLLLFFSPPFIGAGLGVLHQRSWQGLLWGLLILTAMIVLAISLPVIQTARE